MLSRVSSPPLAQLARPPVVRAVRSAAQAAMATPSTGSVTLGVVGLNVGMTAMKTVMAGKAYQMEGYSPHDQKLLFVQEAVRQSVSTALWMGSLMGSMVLTQRLFPKMGVMNTALTSNLFSMVPDTFVRPFLTAKITKWFLPPAPVPGLTDFAASAKSGLAGQASKMAFDTTPKVIMLPG